MSGLEDRHIDMVHMAIRQGNSDVNFLTNMVFFSKHSELDPKIPLRRDQTKETKEWLDFRSIVNDIISIEKKLSLLSSAATPNTVISSIRQGTSDVNILTNMLFFAKHSELDPKIRLRRDQTKETKEWLDFRSIVNDSLELSRKVSPSSPVVTPSSPVGGTPAPTSQPTGEAPAVTVPMDNKQLLEWINHRAEGFHTIGSVAEVLEIFHLLPEWETVSVALARGATLAEVGTGFAALAGALASVLGSVALMVTTVIELYKAFTISKRMIKVQGICYALVAKAAQKNLQPFDPWTGDFPTLDSKEERQEWFRQGTTEGIRLFDTDLKVRNQMILALAYEMLVDNKHCVTSPPGRLLNRLWEFVWKNNDEFRRTSGIRDTHLYWEFNWGTTYLADKDRNDCKPPS